MVGPEPRGRIPGPPAVRRFSLLHRTSGTALHRAAAGQSCCGRHALLDKAAPSPCTGRTWARCCHYHELLNHHTITKRCRCGHHRKRPGPRRKGVHQIPCKPGAGVHMSSDAVLPSKEEPVRYRWIQATTLLHCPAHRLGRNLKNCPHTTRLQGGTLDGAESAGSCMQQPAPTMGRQKAGRGRQCARVRPEMPMWDSADREVG